MRNPDMFNAVVTRTYNLAARMMNLKLWLTEEKGGGGGGGGSNGLSDITC